MKVLVTGASGFIGSSLIQYMNSLNKFELVPLVRKLPEYLNEWMEKFHLLECDIIDFESLSRHVPKDIDAIVHLAACNDVDTKEDPLQALVTNTFGTRNVLKLSTELGIDHVIYFSVLQVYGREMDGHYTIDSPVVCDNDYSLNHFAAEEYCKMYSMNFDLNTSIIRLGYAFGCPVDKGVNRWTIVPEAFCLSAYNKGKIVLKSSGKSVRDFVPLSYISQSVAHLLENPQLGFSLYNLTSEVVIPIIDTAMMAGEIGERVLKRKINLIIKGNEPKVSNNFIAKNNLLGPIKKKNVIETMKNELEKTFFMLNGESQ